MIHYVKREDLEVEMYNGCIENSIQSRIYAFSWYLDIVADHWDVLVLNDYEAVMPIPWKQKYFIKYVTQPFFCQQLGVFSSKRLSKELQEKMIKRIPKKFLKVSLNFNSDNFSTSNMILKNNYILNIESSFEENYKKLNNNRKRDLKKAYKSSLTFDENIEANEFYNFYLLNDKNYSEYNSIKNVLENILKSNNSFIRCYGIRSKTNLIASVLLIKDEKRVTYLVPVSNNLGKKNGASTLLITEIMKKFDTKNYILDFEGSMIKGVANFYKSFGAKKEVYNLLSR